MCSVLLQWYNIVLLLCVSVCILPSQSLCCQKASSALIEERKKREGGTDHGARDDQGGLD